MPLIMPTMTVRESPGGGGLLSYILVTGGANETKFLYPEKDPLGLTYTV